ncbi:putative quinol monooxygenase [Congregibacter sp.]|uniref:putative quinol monooxygenase n=1 Tax=Congregibacter sp. TaxID=2744308 RepID=UPI003F6D4827
MAVGVIATLKIQEGKNAEFEKTFLELAEKVRANEAGCNFYELHVSKTDPQEYKVLEQYATAEDLAKHGQTDYFKAANGALASVVAAAPQIEVLDSVG